MALPKRKKNKQAEVDLSQPDEFISFSQNMFAKAEQNRKPILLAVAGCLAALVLVAGGREVVARKSATRANAFAEAADILAAPVKPPSQEEPKDDSKPALSTPTKKEKTSFETPTARAEAALVALAKVDGGAVSDLAKLGKATALLDSGKFADAVTAYQEFLDSGVGESYLFFGHDGLATAFAESGNIDGAIAELDKIAKLESGSYADHAAFRTARLLESKGDTAGAVKKYNGLLEAHPDSLFKSQATKRLGLLGG